jgi:hypothetical protein
MVPERARQRAEVETLLETVRSAGFRRLVAAMNGYDASETGKERTLDAG